MGRKSRRALDGPFRPRLSAPDLSRAVDVPPTEACSDPTTRQPWVARRTPTAQIRRGLASKVVAVVRAEIFALPGRSLRDVESENAVESNRR